MAGALCNSCKCLPFKSSQQTHRSARLTPGQTAVCTHTEARSRGSFADDGQNASRHACVRQLIGSCTLPGALALGLLSTSGPAIARNVRVEDVENQAMQSGLLAADKGRFDEAERFFQVVLQQDSNSASAWSNLGNVHLSQGRAQDAVGDFSRAVALAPEAPVPIMNRALAEEQLGVDAASSGDIQKAEDLYQQALQDCNGATKLDPKEFAAWFNKGNLLVRLERFGEALDSYRTAADLAPGISGYRLREAELMFQEGEAANADRLMRSVVRRNPRYAEAQAALAAVEWASGKGEAAEEHFEVAVQLNPRWDRMDFVRKTTRWPPALYAAMEKFLSITAGAS